MEITFMRQYRKRETSKMVFVYTVSGTPEELAAYKTAKGTNYREDEKTKQVLLFAARYAGEKATLIKTEKGDYIADTTQDDKIANLTSQGYSYEHAVAKVNGAEVTS